MVRQDRRRGKPGRAAARRGGVLRAGLARAVLLAAALGLGPAAGPPPEAERMLPGGRAGFVDDGGTGCWIWVGGLPGIATEARARWSGACPAGPAEGEGRSEITWREGPKRRAMIYEGHLRAGKAEGRGRLTHTEDGEVLAVEAGEYRDDRFVGGRFELPRIGLVYEGGWAPGGPHGPGRLELRGQRFEGRWERGCLRTKDGWIAITRPAAECEGRAT